MSFRWKTPEVEPHELDESLPLIYMWEITDQDGNRVGRYVGKAKSGAKRPRTHYARNVNRLLADKPYRKNKPDQYRRVHKALAHAALEGHKITLSFLCNVRRDENINEVERRYIRLKGSSGLESWQLND